MTQRRILFIHGGLLTFTKIDLDILRSQHDVREVYVCRADPISLLRTMFRALAGVLWCDIVFSWFGAYHALLPFALARLLGKGTMVVASGYDVADQPEIDYGNMRPGIRRWVGFAVFRLADRILAVSDFTAGELSTNAGVPAEKVQVIVHGIPIPLSAQVGYTHPKEPLVLTVATVARDNLTLKGLITFIEAARILPKIPFLVVGPWKDEAVETLRATAPSNVALMGPLYGDALVDLMCRVKVYTQLSAYESFGMALAESMSCGAVPVTTRRAAIAEVVGECGEYAPYGDAAATADAIVCALASGPERGMQARERILTCFSLEARQAALLREVDAVMRPQLI